MAEQLIPIASLANSSVQTVIALANAIVNVVATTVVTANASANGAITNGNGYVSGIFGASILVAGKLRGGNVAGSANLVIDSNTFINSASFSIGNTTVNAVMNSISLAISNIDVANATIDFFPQAALTWANANITDVNLVTTGTSQVTLDAFPIASYRTAEYVIQVTDNVANNYQCSKFLVTHDGGNPLFTEYGLLTTNSVIATFTATSNSTQLALKITPASTNTSVRAVRTTLNV